MLLQVMLLPPKIHPLCTEALVLVQRCSFSCSNSELLYVGQHGHGKEEAWIWEIL